MVKADNMTEAHPNSEPS